MQWIDLRPPGRIDRPSATLPVGRPQGQPALNLRQQRDSSRRCPWGTCPTRGKFGLPLYKHHGQGAYRKINPYGADREISGAGHANRSGGCRAICGGHPFFRHSDAVFHIPDQHRLIHIDIPPNGNCPSYPPRWIISDAKLALIALLEELESLDQAVLMAEMEGGNNPGGRRTGGYVAPAPRELLPGSHEVSQYLNQF